MRKDLIYKQAPGLTLKADGVTGGWSGYAAGAGNIDRQGDVIAPGALGRAAKAFLAGSPIALWNHDSNHPVGRIVKAAEDLTGLAIDGVFASTPDAQTKRQLVLDGVPLSMSIGFTCLSSTWIEGERAISDYLASIGKSVAKLPDCKWGIKVINELELVEISLVSVPANPAAKVTGAKIGPHGQTGLRVSEVRDDLRTLGLWVTESRKAGRVLSAANRERLAGLAGQLAACRDDLDALLAECMPDKEGESDMVMATIVAGSAPPTEASDSPEKALQSEIKNFRDELFRVQLAIASL